MTEKNSGNATRTRGLQPIEIPCFGVFENRTSHRPLFVSAGLDSNLSFQNAAAYLKCHNQLTQSRRAIVRRARAVAEFGREVVRMN